MRILYIDEILVNIFRKIFEKIEEKLRLMKNNVDNCKEVMLNFLFRSFLKNRLHNFFTKK